LFQVSFRDFRSALEKGTFVVEACVEGYDNVAEEKTGDDKFEKGHFTWDLLL